MDTVNFVRLARVYQIIKEMLGDIPFQIGGEALLNAIITKQLEEKLYSNAPNGCANDFDDNIVEILVSEVHQQAVFDQIALGKWVSYYGTKYRLNIFEGVIDMVQCARFCEYSPIDLRFVFCSTAALGQTGISQIIWPSVKMRSDNITWYMQNPLSMIASYALFVSRDRRDDLALLYLIDCLIENGMSTTGILSAIKVALPVPLYIDVCTKVCNISNTRNYL